MVVIAIASLTLLNAQSRWVNYGQTVFNDDPIENVLIEVSLSPNGSPFFVPALPDNSTNSSSDGHWLLYVNHTLFPHALFDRVKVVGTNKPCVHVELTLEETVPYDITNVVNFQFNEYYPDPAQACGSCVIDIPLKSF